MKKNITAAFLIFLTCSLSAQERGHLVIIGGGDRPDNVTQKIIELAGGTDAKILVIPNASSDPVESGENSVKEFMSAGCTNVSYLYCTRDQADLDSMVKKLDGATGIYFGGGDQAFLTRDLLGTKLFNTIKTIYLSGGLVSGTSAGAAVMSRVMITGNELKNRDSSNIFKTIEAGNVEHTEGFGFIENAIIDQHFIKRKRLNRLISKVLEYPDLIGIGIDESTCIIMKPDDTFEVMGENQVVIFDPLKTSDIRKNDKGIFGVRNLRMDILLSGDKYDMNKHSVIE